jgi:hypothetical protein
MGQDFTFGLFWDFPSLGYWHVYNYVEMVMVSG